jgi:hypothetical protein
MGELKRDKDELTTADLAGRGDAADRRARDLPRDTPETGGPRLVRNEPSDEAIPLGASTVADKPANTPREGTFGGEAARGTSALGKPTLLFSESDMSDLRSQWSKVQVGFVDEPRRSVEEADSLVATVMQRLAEGFARERSTLEQQWDRGSDVSTEDLRVALQRYRDFFDRLLSA